MFASCLPDVINEAEECIVECEKRLVTLYRRSFPKAKIIKKKCTGKDLLSLNLKTAPKVSGNTPIVSAMTSSVLMYLLYYFYK